jgi:anthraniloyl-CoA monooxygenase
MTETSPIFTPLQLRALLLDNRIVLAPMAQYRATEGIANEWHFVHYAERAKGGAGLLITEMTAVSSIGRITPGCTGLYTPRHVLEWKKINDFIHAESRAKTCLQLGHAGPKGSTQVGWAEALAPLVNGNWGLFAASALPHQPGNATPRAMEREDMDKVLRQFVKATEMAEEADFDMVELNAGQGFLLGSFLSPASNQREDDYGGSLENRLRFPLEVFREIRAAFPGQKPMSVRLDAEDFATGGIAVEEASEIALMFAAEGADILAFSGGDWPAEAPTDAPTALSLSETVRSETGFATMAGGGITRADQADAVLKAEQADLISLGLGLLDDPYWTLHQARALGEASAQWPKPYRAVQALKP